MSDSLITQLASRPDDQALWTELFTKLRPAVYFKVYRSCNGQKELAADVTQDAFERFVRYAELSQFKQDEEVLYYLNKIAMHVLADTLVKARATETLDPTQLEELLEAKSVENLEEPKTEHELKSLYPFVDRAERDLLDNLARGRSVEQIAQILGVNYGVAVVRIHRLKKKLRNSINHLRH